MSIIEKAVGKLDRETKNNQHRIEAGGVTEQRGVVHAEAATAFSDDYKTVTVDEVAMINLPVGKFKALGMVTLDRPRSQIAEEYRIIKRPLLLNISGKGAAPVKNSNMIMVTSSLQGEGKTFTTLNLAMSMALEEDKTVLFIDADFSKGTASSILEIPADRPGLIDVLQDDNLQISDVLLHTDVPNLRVIPAGRLHERSTELLASKGMQELMSELSGRYPDRVVVFDSPPLLLTTEASVLASLMGQIVFVVAAEQTSTETITAALEHLGSDKVVGTVLNKTKKYIWDHFRYGHGYGYGYGYGQSSQAKAS
jgi:receptor protein-tyrosine kinase